MAENTIKKGLIIIGERDTGKTVLANYIASLYTERECYKLESPTSTSLTDPFLFQNMTPDHKIILIDDVNSINQIRQTYFMINSVIRVIRRGWPDYERICPRIIITSKSLLLEDLIAEGNTFLRRYDVIEVSGCGYHKYPTTDTSTEFDSFFNKELQIKELIPLRDVYEKFQSESLTSISLPGFRYQIKEWAKRNNYRYNPSELSNVDGKILARLNGRIAEFIFIKPDLIPQISN